MEARRRRVGGDPPDYEAYGDHFSVEIHHGGFFCGLGKNRTYVDEKNDWFDYCEADTWSLLWLEDFVNQLGYGSEYQKLRLFWCRPGKTVVDGLVALRGDSEMLSMISASAECRNLVVYIDHVKFLEKQNFDDVLLDGFKPLPAVISPKKVVHLESSGSDMPLSFYDGIQKLISPKKRSRSEHRSSSAAVDLSSEDENKADDEDEDSDLDSDFVSFL